MNRLNELKEKYWNGLSSFKDEEELVELLKSSNLAEDEALLSELLFYLEFKTQKPNADFENELMRTINSEQARVRNTWVIRIAASLVLIVLSFDGGFYFGSGRKGANQIDQMQADIRELQQISTEVLLRQESAHDRLKAMVIANSLAIKPDSSTLELILGAYTADENIGIRLSALELLNNYTSDRYIRSRLINSLETQQSEIILFKLINIATELKERSAIPVMERLKQQNTISAELQSEIKSAITAIKS